MWINDNHNCLLEPNNNKTIEIIGADQTVMFRQEAGIMPLIILPHGWKPQGRAWVVRLDGAVMIRSPRLEAAGTGAGTRLVVRLHGFDCARRVRRDDPKRSTQGSIIWFFARKFVEFYARATYLDSKGSFPLADSKGSAFGGFQGQRPWWVWAKPKGSSER